MSEPQPVPAQYSVLSTQHSAPLSTRTSSASAASAATRPIRRGPLWGGCPACAAADKPSNLYCVYDYPAVARALDRAALARRPPTMWRYGELLPVDAAHAVSLDEGWTPLLRAERLGRAYGLDHLYLKDEVAQPHLELQGPPGRRRRGQGARAGRGRARRGFVGQRRRGHGSLCRARRPGRLPVHHRAVPADHARLHAGLRRRRCSSCRPRRTA